MCQTVNVIFIFQKKNKLRRKIKEGKQKISPVESSRYDINQTHKIQEMETSKTSYQKNTAKVTQTSQKHLPKSFEPDSNAVANTELEAAHNSKEPPSSFLSDNFTE